MQKLDETAVNSKLDDIPDWALVNDEIQRTFGFADFVTSIEFVNRIATAAEAAQHHPDILIRYNKVTLTLSTHDAGGITQNDFDLAKAADSFV
ncbi:MAG: 4a-hydroxytetrahydrobiopterin dehydratase [Planctomycetota bacterium]